MRNGTRVTIWLQDGRKLHGLFLGSLDSLSTTPLPMARIGGTRAVTPLRSVLALGTNHGVEQLPIEDVRRVSVPVMRGKVLGLFAGLAVDVAWVFHGWSQMD